MATMRRLDSKEALGRQRAELRRGARGKVHVGDDAGGAAAKASELRRVHMMQAAVRARREDAAREARKVDDRTEEPWIDLLVDIVLDGARLARTVMFLPLRLAAALIGRGPRASEA